MASPSGLSSAHPSGPPPLSSNSPTSPFHSSKGSSSRKTALSSSRTARPGPFLPPHPHDNTQPFHNSVEKDAFGALLTASFAQALAQPPFSTTSSSSSPFQAAGGAGGSSSAYYDLYNQQHPPSTTELDRPLQKNEGHEEGYVGQMQLGVGSFQHFEHALGQAPSAPTADASTSTVFGSHESLGEGDGSTQRGDDPFAAMSSRKTSVGTAASDSSSVFEDSPHGPLGVGAGYDGFVGGAGAGGGGEGRRGEGGLVLLQRDMASILRLDVQQSGVLIYELIGLLNESQEVFDRSLAPERQSPAGRERLLQLANYISEHFAVVQKVAESWPNCGLWLITKAFDCWIGHLT